MRLPSFPRRSIQCLLVTLAQHVTAQESWNALNAMDVAGFSTSAAVAGSGALVAMKLAMSIAVLVVEQVVAERHMLDRIPCSLPQCRTRYTKEYMTA